MKHQKQGGKAGRFNDVELLEARIKKETPETGVCLPFLFRTTFMTTGLRLWSKNWARRIQMKCRRDLDFTLRTLRSPTTSKKVPNIVYEGLKKKKFERLTEIQRCVIPHALAKRDILAASKTGSGKTLAYLIPIIENLYREKWTPLDGLGAIVLVPTRELVRPGTLMLGYSSLRSYEGYFRVHWNLNGAHHRRKELRSRATVDQEHDSPHLHSWKTLTTLARHSQLRVQQLQMLSDWWSWWDHSHGFHGSSHRDIRGFT